MNELLFKLLIDKSIKRRVYILYLVFESTYPLTLIELEKLCVVSKKTLQQDVSFLLEELPNNLRLVTINKQHALEVFGDKSILIDFIDAFVENNSLFTVIKTIYEGQRQSLTTVSEELFITEATLRKYLLILKSVLAEYNLVLLTNPLDIVGNEIDVRYFYFQYFKNIHKSAQLKISKELDTLLNNGLIEFEKIMPHLNCDYHQMIVYFAITNERRKQQKFVMLSDSLILNYANNKGYQLFRNTYKQLSKSSKADTIQYLNEQELVYSYILLFSCIFYDSDNGGYYFANDFYENLNDFEKLIQSYFVQAKLIFGLNVEFSLIIKSFLTNIKILTNLSPMFQKVSLQTKKIAEEKYPEILKHWFSLLKGQTNFAYPYDIAASLTLLTAAKAHRHKRILFCLTGESSSLSYLKAMALRTVPKEMEVQFHFNYTLDNLLLEKCEIDICVVNFEPIHELKFSQLVRLSDFPLDREWTELLLMLHDMQDNLSSTVNKIELPMN